MNLKFPYYLRKQEVLAYILFHKHIFRTPLKIHIKWACIKLRNKLIRETVPHMFTMQRSS